MNNGLNNPRLEEHPSSYLDAKMDFHSRQIPTLKSNTVKMQNNHSQQEEPPLNNYGALLNNSHNFV